MKRFWQSFGEHILAPTELNGRQLIEMLTPAGRSIHLRRHAASVIIARVRLIAALFAILVPLFGMVDLLVFPIELAVKLIALRFAAAGIFVALAWPHDVSAAHPYRHGIALLVCLLLVPPLFHFFSSGWLQAHTHTPMQQFIALLYGYLPMIVLGGLAIFPLTAIESLLLSLPVILTSLFTLLFHGQTLGLVEHGGALWFMIMMLGVAMFSGMSQCHYMATLVHKAMHDPLTGAYTRQSGEEALSLLMRLSALSGNPLTLAFIDLDRFKAINDTYGHEAGDFCLKTLAERLQTTLRRSDLLIRWGGEEFVAVLPDTPIERAPILFERLRQQGFGTRPDGSPLTASIGVAHSHEPGGNAWEMLIHRADERMYQAKSGGRDRIVWPSPASAQTEGLDHIHPSTPAANAAGA